VHRSIQRGVVTIEAAVILPGTSAWRRYPLVGGGSDLEGKQSRAMFVQWR